MIRYRPMRLRDIPDCAGIVAAHPVLGRRYGPEIANLGAFWRRLLANEWYPSVVVFEEVQRARVKMVGAGIAVFVSDDFLQEAQTPPSFWLGPEITRRIKKGKSPLLTEKQVVEANSRDGLNLVVLQTGYNPEHFTQPDAQVVAATAFVEYHRGYQLKEVFAQAESAEHLAGILNFGTLVFGATEGENRSFDLERLHRLVQQPHLVGLNRETVARQRGSWFASLFVYQPPRLRFRRGEQQLLLAAMYGDLPPESAHGIIQHQTLLT